MSSVVTALDCARICSDCSKYVFNSCESDCQLSDCCHFHFRTHEVELQSDNDSEYSVEVGECCLLRRSYANQGKKESDE